MPTHHFPKLAGNDIGATRAALHAYAGVPGAYLKSCQPKRKHWWHASLRPSLAGLTTGVVHAGISFELELNLREGVLRGRTSAGADLTEALVGQPASDLAAATAAFLLANGLDDGLIPKTKHSTADSSGYSAAQAASMAEALNSVGAAMAEFRAGIAEETSPVQLWPHHFDLSMLWLPGEKIAGQDPADEEHSDKQMNFGFTFGDEGNPEPYFYVTAYPLPDEFPTLPLPAGTRWQTEGFSGAVLPYQSLIANADPKAYLLDLWQGLLWAGREHMLVNAPALSTK